MHIVKNECVWRVKDAYSFSNFYLKTVLLDFVCVCIIVCIQKANYSFIVRM